MSRSKAQRKAANQFKEESFIMSKDKGKAKPPQPSKGRDLTALDVYEEQQIRKANKEYWE